MFNNKLYNQYFILLVTFTSLKYKNIKFNFLFNDFLIIYIINNSNNFKNR